MKNVIYLFLFFTTICCSQDKQPLIGETEYQREANAKFKDATKSPLTEKDRKSFKSLDFFKFDSTYVVTASFEKLENQEVFEMQTSTERLPKYIKYGILTFEINAKEYKLFLYQNIELVKREGYENHLFLPFLDNTNGEGSYGGGRYIDVQIPEGGTMAIDFNEAYNPYCAYNPNYSCPVVPLENYIDVEIKAGVKAYKKH